MKKTNFHIIFFFFSFVFFSVNFVTAQTDTIRKKIVIRDTVRVRIVVRDTVRKSFVIRDTIKIQDTIHTIKNTAKDNVKKFIDSSRLAYLDFYYLPNFDLSARNLKTNMSFSSFGLGFGYVVNNNFSLVTGINYSKYKSELSNKQSVNSNFYEYSGEYEYKVVDEFYIRNQAGEIIETRYITKKEWNPKADSTVITGINSYRFIEIPLSIKQTLYEKQHFRLRYYLNLKASFILSAKGIIKSTQGELLNLSKTHINKTMISFSFGMECNYTLSNDIVFFAVPSLQYYINPISSSSDFSKISFTPVNMTLGMRYYIK